MVSLRSDVAAPYVRESSFAISATDSYPLGATRFERAAAIDPGDIRIAFYKGLAAEQDGQKAEAVRVWTELLARAPADASAARSFRHDALERRPGRRGCVRERRPRSPGTTRPRSRPSDRPSAFACRRERDRTLRLPSSGPPRSWRRSYSRRIWTWGSWRARDCATRSRRTSTGTSPPPSDSASTFSPVAGWTGSWPPRRRASRRCPVGDPRRGRATLRADHRRTPFRSQRLPHAPHLGAAFEVTDHRLAAVEPEAEVGRSDDGRTVGDRVRHPPGPGCTRRTCPCRRPASAR